MMKEFNGRKTYCNPLPLPDYPISDDFWNCMAFTEEPKKWFRSASDPSVLYYDGKWYLYPSYGMAFYTEDFATWKHHRCTPYNMTYSPVVVPFGDRFLMTSHSHGLYTADNPLGDFTCIGDFIMPDGTEFKPIDPALFVDDDGRLYMYWFFMEDGTHKRTFLTGTLGAELDPADPRRLLCEPKVLFTFDPAHPWEHFGEKRKDTLCGWIEGQWMFRRNGRYYLVYATSGTEFTNYCLAAYISDEGPLADFRIQKNSPFLLSRSRLISGSGHGCVTEGPGGTIWAFYTTSVTYTHIYERVIGMDLLDINEEGELYAPHGVTDTPQFAPGENEDPVASNDTGLINLTARERARIRATSHKYGRDALYALDESLFTFWEPEDTDPAPSFVIDLMAPYRCSAMRIFWRDVGLDPDHGAAPGPFRYLLEGKPDNDREEWITLIDARDNDTDLMIDYRTFETVTCESVRLTVTGHPEGITPGVIDFSVFGIRDESL